MNDAEYETQLERLIALLESEHPKTQEWLSGAEERDAAWQERRARWVAEDEERLARLLEERAARDRATRTMKRWFWILCLLTGLGFGFGFGVGKAWWDDRHEPIRPECTLTRLEDGRASATCVEPLTA